MDAPVAVLAGLGLVGGLFGLAACADKQVVDDPVAAGPCRETGRVDDTVKKEAIAEFKRFGRICELYNLTANAENEQETVWRVCCGEAALTYAYYPGKCVARRTSNGLIQCGSGEALTTPAKADETAPLKPPPPPATP
ncbi:MAG TPA: hypothetical protein PKI03_30410 [Pseudomonadota bacterium]|nr:hypothetical protein [Pseudomonadota bacterium]